jgi:hypothetical protein
MEPMAVNAGSPMIVMSTPAFLETEYRAGLFQGGWKTRRAVSPETYKKELIDSGIDGNTISCSYRQYRQNLARPELYQELKHDLSESKSIVSRSYRIAVESADNETIHFRGEAQ